MKTFNRIFCAMLVVLFVVASSSARRSSQVGANAALHYWAAFSQVQDAGITSQEAKELNAVLDGTTPYDDARYNGLLQKNALAIKIMARGTEIPQCDWGLDYGLGDDTPVEYVRKALTLGRLNVLYALHLFKTGNKDEAVHALVAGLRFSRDVANGGSLFPALNAKDLITLHLRATAEALQQEQLSVGQRQRLQDAVLKLGPHGVDWRSAINVEMQLLNKPPWQVSTSLKEVTQAYLAAAVDPARLERLEQLEQLLASLPEPLRDVIPNPQEVVQQKQELDEKIQQTRSLLQ
jgi:hypothetical protein